MITFPFSAHMYTEEHMETLKEILNHKKELIEEAYYLLTLWKMKIMIPKKIR